MFISKLTARVGRQRMLSDMRGDTIIEVLIAIGIVSLVLTSAYAVTNQNAQASQKIQEQGQAQKLVERQIELMRSYSGDPAGGCLVINSGVVSRNTGVACQNIAAAGSGAKYNLTISKPGIDYVVSATWATLGAQTGNVTMYYRR